MSQSTSLYNIVVEMSTASGNQHQGNTFTNLACSPSNNLPLGLHMENGSGGFMGGKLLRHFLGAVANSLQISSSTVGILESGLETNSMFLSY